MFDKSQKIILKELQLLTEMAGIPIRISGLNYKLWIGHHGMSKHFKSYVKVMDGNNDLASVSIEDPIKILVGDPTVFDRKSWEKIVEFITINREVLLNFYNHATDRNFDDVKDFYEKLKPVS